MDSESAAPGFTTAAELARDGPASSLAAAPSQAPVGGLLVAPEVGIEQAKKLWNAYLEFKEVILADPACFDEIDGHREINRTGATRLALPFGLSIEERGIEEGRVEIADDATFDYRFRVRVRVSKGSRFVDGIGSCRVSEIPGKMDASKKEHFALTKAWTRASKRAIADILGGTEAE